MGVPFTRRPKILEVIIMTSPSSAPPAQTHNRTVIMDNDDHPIDDKSVHVLRFGDFITRLQPRMYMSSKTLHTVDMSKAHYKIIPDKCFGNCQELRILMFPPTLEQIGNQAFKCTRIASLTIPGSVNIIGYEAFASCWNLKYVKFIGLVINLKECIFFACSELETVIFPESWKIIASSMFEECKKLKNCHLPDNIVRIHNYAFAYCSSLTLDVLPQGLVSIGDYAFIECTKIQISMFPLSLINIGVWAFAYCHSLETIKFLGDDCTLNERIFLKCINLKHIDLPHKLKAIPFRLFDACESLQWLNIPESVTELRESAFSGSGLHMLKIPKNMRICSQSVFRLMPNLRVVVFENPNMYVQMSRELAHLPSIRLLVCSDNCISLFGLQRNRPFPLQLHYVWKNHNRLDNKPFKHISCTPRNIKYAISTLFYSCQTHEHTHMKWFTACYFSLTQRQYTRCPLPVEIVMMILNYILINDIPST